MLLYLLIFLGSGCGGVLRYAIGSAADAWFAPEQGTAGHATFPLGTLLVNITGCFAMGLLIPLSMREEWRMALLVGVLGGYTTFSAFGRDALTLANEGQWARAGLYIALSVAGSLAAVWLGWRIGLLAFARPG